MPWRLRSGASLWAGSQEPSRPLLRPIWAGMLAGALLRRMTGLAQALHSASGQATRSPAQGLQLLLPPLLPVSHCKVGSFVPESSLCHHQKRLLAVPGMLLRWTALILSDLLRLCYLGTLRLQIQSLEETLMVLHKKPTFPVRNLFSAMLPCPLHLRSRHYQLSSPCANVPLCGISPF